MTTAAALTEQMRTPDGRDKRDGNPEAIYAVVMDDSNVHCLTESMLDAWWQNLSPAAKGDIYERSLDADMDEAVAVESFLRSIRNPLDRVYAAGQLLVDRYSSETMLTAPTFAAAELALLRRDHRRRPTQ